MKKLFAFSILFCFVGIVNFGGALYLYLQKKAFLEKAEKVEGTVVKLISERSNSTYYGSVVAFKTKRNKDIINVSFISDNLPSYHLEQKVVVFYDPANPNNAEIDDFFSLWKSILEFGVVGIVCFLAGFFTIFINWLKNKRAQNLRETGKTIATKFTQVQLNTTYTINGRSPFQIYSQWLDPHTDKLYVFKSDNIWFDPTDFVKTDTLRVFIDPENPSKYTMDISFLPVLRN